MQTQQTLWVTETSTENWQQVTIPNYPAGNNWNEVSSGNIDLSAYAGKKIKFAFKYVSTTAAAATWEVYDVKVVANGEGGGSVTPEPGQETTACSDTRKCSSAPELARMAGCRQREIGDLKPAAHVQPLFLCRH